MHAAADGESVLTGLFPEGVAAVLVRVDDELPSFYPAEREAIAKAGPLRRREFLAGRACAHAALRAIGRDGQAIERGPGRAPLWPQDVVGSISHSGGLAAAVVAPTAVAWSVGLDIEVLDPPLDASLEQIVLAPGERTSVDGMSKLVFAVKECVYKCLYPRTRWKLDFHDVCAQIDPRRGCYRAVVDPRFTRGGRPLAPLHGRIEVWEGLAFAGLFMASPGPDPGTGRSPRERRRSRACSSASV